MGLQVYRFQNSVRFVAPELAKLCKSGSDGVRIAQVNESHLENLRQST